MDPSSVVAPATDACRRSHRQLAVTLERPDGSHTQFVVPQPFARVGRDRRAEITLDDPRLLPCHAYLESSPEGVYCAGLAASVSTGWLLPNVSIQINGVRIHAALHGHQPTSFIAPDLQTKHSASPPHPQVRIFAAKDGESEFTDYSLSRRLTLVGRQSPATWRIKHATLSRLHCALVWEAGELWLIDLFSSNGTRVKGHRFDVGKLEVGQDFSLGTVRCRYLGFAAISSTDTPATDVAGIVVENRDVPSAVATLPVPTPFLEDAGEARRTDSEAAGDGRPRPDLPAEQLPSASPAGQPGSAPAALVDTSVSAAGDTKFVESPSVSPFGSSNEPQAGTGISASSARPMTFRRSSIEWHQPRVG